MDLERAAPVSARQLEPHFVPPESALETLQTVRLGWISTHAVWQHCRQPHFKVVSNNVMFGDVENAVTVQRAVKDIQAPAVG